jgi:hypothetical protein
MTDQTAVSALTEELRIAWRAGRSHGRIGGSRSADPFINGDGDLHLAWDEGWIVGAGECDQRERSS